MSRYFLLALFLSLLSLTSGLSESILEDSAGHAVTLPTTGGNNSAELTTLTATRPTSPYVLQIKINNGQVENNPNNPIVGAIESFYFNTRGPLFRDATLISQVYSPSFTNGTGGTPGQYFANATHPNNRTGVYTFTFFIPVGAYFEGTLTYINTGLNPLPVVDVITIIIFNPSMVVGDPQFVGLRGQSYQVHGVDGLVYNLISEKNMQANARFTFLTEGDCPMINGVADINCWSHPGSYLGELSFQQVVDGKLHAAHLVAGNAKEGFASIQVDGKAMKVGQTVTFGSFSVEYSTSHSVHVSTEHFDFELSNSDMFINQALRSKVALSKLSSHGLLGQTHSLKRHSSSIQHIEGEVDDYSIADNDIFGHDFVYNQFQA